MRTRPRHAGMAAGKLDDSIWIAWVGGFDTVAIAAMFGNASEADVANRLAILCDESHRTKSRLQTAAVAS